MTNSVPNSFFKYCTVNTTKIVLKSGRFRWSAASLFNDPYELQIRPKFGNSQFQVRNDWILKIINHVFGESALSLERATKTTRLTIKIVKVLKNSGLGKEDIFKNLTNDIDGADPQKIESIWKEWFNAINPQSARMLCISESGDNLLMWSHYTNSHQGCVLELQHLSQYDTPLLAAKKIKYVDKMPELPVDVNQLLYGADISNNRQVLEMLFFTKHMQWAYENEWRALTFRNPTADHDDFAFIPEEIKSIRLGAKISINDRSEIITCVKLKYPQTKILAAKLSNDNFEIIFEDG